MHPNPVFRQVSEDEALAFAAARGFGVITVAAADRLLAAHVPFTLAERRLEAHLARANPILASLEGGPLPALTIISGPDGYISPDWYGEEGHVPTWNYLAVHLRGRLRRLEGAALRAHLERLSETFERRLAPKPVWRLDELAEGRLAAMMRAIVPVALEIEAVETTFKLGQNRSVAARAAAGRALAGAGGPGLETAALGRLMEASVGGPGTATAGGARIAGEGPERIDQGGQTANKS